jgi:diadenosine tetraphosphate (Ap4A) HIT family hydrolase
VAADERLRILRVLDAPDFPAFYRVVWRAHVAEFTDLSLADRLHCMEAVAGVEQVLREMLAPTKINLASLGNVVPHLHWHVIARFADDSHFPQPIWGTRQREPSPSIGERLVHPLTMVDQSVRAMLEGLPSRLVSIAGSAHQPPAP